MFIIAVGRGYFTKQLSCLQLTVTLGRIFLYTERCSRMFTKDVYMQ